MRLYFLLFYIFFFSVLHAQTSTVYIYDKDNKEPLIGATILSNNGNTTSDIDGNFTLKFMNFPDTLIISYIGYDTEKYIIQSNNDIPTAIEMANLVILETMTVTASKYEKRISESTISIDILKPELISNSNAITIDDALDKVSGVQMIDGQANIRGGSGYSYGAGSRVMLLVDDMPALQVDAGFPNWGDIPVENIDQVEIVKGAASALYGSAALNGIINIRTGTPSSEPETKISASYLTWGDPKDSRKKWWGDTTRYTYNVSAVHKQKFNNLDVVASGFYLKEESFNRATYDERGRGTLKLKYRLSDKSFIGLNTLFNKGENGDFFIWDFADSTAFEPFEGSAAVHKNQRFYIDPSYVVEDSKGNIHRLLTRFHKINNDNSGNQSNSSSTLYGEYQFQRNIEKYDALITTGIVGTRSTTDSELFGDTTFLTRVFAGYLQGEKKFFDKLNISTGVRYEYNRQDTPEEFNGNIIEGGVLDAGKWIARVGASYEYMPYSSVRASWGQGFRFPTITERFISTTFGIFQIRSNPDLIPESGYSAELGIKQGIKIGAFKGFLDLAVFTSSYTDMMEFVFGFSAEGASFTSQNVGNTEIKGFEFSLFGTADIGQVQLSGFGGFTYIDPKYRNFEGNEMLQESLSSGINVLKYRSRYSTKMDLQADYKNFSIGGAVIQASHMENIDAVLEGRGLAFGNDFDLLGLKAYRIDNNSGFTRFDVRASIKFGDVKTSFLIGNLTNIEYTLRPALMEGPRNYALRIDYTLQ